MPGHGVGVADGGGDHDPDVGGADQLGGEDAVVGDEGVDVGRVEEGEPARAGCRRSRCAATFALGRPPRRRAVSRASRPSSSCCGHPHAGEVGQHPHPGEPVVVVRMADQHGRTGGGPQHARLADPPPHKGVDEGGLAGAGGSADDGEQRRFGVPAAGAPGSRRAARAVRRGLAARVGPPAGAAGNARRRHGRAGRRVRRSAEAVRPRSPHAKNAQFWRLFEAYEPSLRADRTQRDGRDEWGAGITSAQHPGRETPKAVQDSYLPAIIGPLHRTSTSCHGGEATGTRRLGALSLSPARSRTTHTRAPGHRGHHPAPVAQWIEQAPSKRLAAGSSPAGGAQPHTTALLPGGPFCWSGAA